MFTHYSLTRDQENLAMLRFARGWLRTHHQHRRPLPPLLPRHPANPYRSLRSTGLKSLGPTPGALQTNQRNPETAALLVNRCAPPEGQMVTLNMEGQGRRFGSIREALANHFPHSGEPDAVEKNRTFPQDHQSNSRKMNH